MRKVLTRLGAAIAVVVVIAVVVDFGATIFAEYRLARSVRAAAQLSWDPSVAILGFPFFPQALHRRYGELEIKANDVEHAHVGKASLEATMHAVDLAESTWLIGPDASLPIGKLESRIIIDSRHLGGFMGISDLVVEAPTRDINEQGGSHRGGRDKPLTTESGISDSHGLIFTGTPTAAGFDKRVSVSVDLTTGGPDHATLVITPTRLLTGPGTAQQDVPDDRVAAVLSAFKAELPDQRLPFGVAPTSQGARGSDVIIEGITEGVTVQLNGFRQS
ncbi:MAG: mannan chain length control protein LmeA [Mycobacterium sp.]